MAALQLHCTWHNTDRISVKESNQLNHQKEHEFKKTQVGNLEKAFFPIDLIENTNAVSSFSVSAWTMLEGSFNSKGLSLLLGRWDLLQRARKGQLKP